MNKSIVRTCDLLELFTDDHAVLSLKEISAITGDNRATLHHVLSTLVEIGWLERDRHHKYQLGMRLLILGTRVLRRIQIEELADTHLRHLQQALHETTHLAVVEGTEAVYVKKIEAERSIRMASRVGMRVPLHASAVGKVLLTFNPHLLAMVTGHPLQARTRRTITDATQLNAHLDLVRRNKYAIDHEEFEDGLFCLAAPVYDYRGCVVAAVSASGPTSRMRSLTVDRVRVEVGRCARGISRDMGCTDR